jgi:hypothetical protein
MAYGMWCYRQKKKGVAWLLTELEKLRGIRKKTGKGTRL